MFTTRLFIALLYFAVLCSPPITAQTVGEYLEAVQRNIELGQYHQAIKNLDVVIKLEPDNFQALAQRGFAKSNLLIFSEAILDYDKAINVNPNDTWVLGNRAKLKIQTGDFQGAIDDLDRSIQLDPKDPWDYMMRGEAKYLALKKHYRATPGLSYFGAVDDFSKALALDHNFGYAFMRRAQSRLDSLHHNEFIPSVQELESICDDWLLAANNGVENALQHIEKNCGVQISGIIAGKMHKIARWHIIQQEYNKALALYNTLIQNYAESPGSSIGFLFERGDLYFSQGKFYEAIADYSQLVSSLVSHPDKSLSGKAYYLRALCHNRSNNPESAIDDLNQAVNLGYQFSWVYYERGVAYNMIANKDAACQDWEISASKGNSQAEDLFKENCKKGFSLFKKKK